MTGTVWSDNAARFATRAVDVDRLVDNLLAGLEADLAEYAGHPADLFLAIAPVLERLERACPRAPGAVFHLHHHGGPLCSPPC